MMMEGSLLRYPACQCWNSTGRFHQLTKIFLRKRNGCRMKKVRNLLCLFIVLFTIINVSPKNIHLMIAPATLTENTVSLLWDKQTGTDVVYEIVLNERLVASTGKISGNLAGGLCYGQV